MDVFGLLFTFTIVIGQGYLTYLAWFRIERLFELQRKHSLLITLVEWYQGQTWYPWLVRASSLAFFLMLVFAYFFIVLPTLLSK